ncbi:MAG: phage terminase large subunit family protein [Deltaproteobacteria bacterium]|nr:phage terminase large subunit family protein [Deltaproteobacteria bacterium]
MLPDLHIPAVAWFPSERAALTLPADLTVSQWAEAHREFPKDASFPGRWDPHKAPYTVGPMDAFTDPRVERLTLMASARSVKTECWMNMLGYIICQDPGPALVVAPTETKVKRICKRITKMIKASPELRQYLTGNPDDLQKRSIVLKHMEIIFATAGSASDLGEFEARYVFETETDKYQETAGGYGSPTQMAEMRALTFWNRKIITDCNPTAPDGFISKDYDRSDRRKLWVPCPQCGGYQVLDFFRLKHRGEKRMDWPKPLQEPEYIKQTRPAVYECRFCGAEIEERHKEAMIAAGVWSSQPADIYGFPLELGEMPPDGSRPEPALPAAHVGCWWNTMISAFASWQEMAAKFFEVQKDREQRRTFWNEWLGLVWKEVVTERPAAAVLNLCSHRPPMELPEDVLGITAGIDNQKRGFWISVWAWQLLRESRSLEQHMIRYGYVQHFEELEEWLFRDLYRNHNSSVELTVSYAAIDTGGGEGEPGEATQTDQIYNWLRRSGRGRVFGIKGASKPGPGALKAWRSTSAKTPAIPDGLWLLDTHALKEAFWSRVAEGKVHLHAGTKEDFAAQLTAEIKVRVKNKEVWQNVGNRANHLLDTAIYALALAEPEWLNIIRWPVVQPRDQAAGEFNGPGTLNPLTGKPRGSFFKRG